VAVEVKHRNDELDQQNCLDAVALEYPAPKPLTPEVGKYEEGAGASRELRAEEEVLSTRRAEAVEAC
jgi:hypothetical protein